jgi:hypothetical protein
MVPYNNFNYMFIRNPRRLPLQNKFSSGHKTDGICKVTAAEIKLIQISSGHSLIIKVIFIKFYRTIWEIGGQMSWDWCLAESSIDKYIKWQYQALLVDMHTLDLLLKPKIEYCLFVVNEPTHQISLLKSKYFYITLYLYQ